MKLCASGMQEIETAMPISECIVHHRKYRSKFHCTVNRIRRSTSFEQQVYNTLHSRCCSCGTKQGININLIKLLFLKFYHVSTITVGIKLIDPTLFRDMCDKINSEILEKSKQSTKSLPCGPIEFISLPFPSTHTPLVRQRKVGCFIGKKGKNIRVFQYNYNIRVRIIDERSKKKLRPELIEALCFNKECNSNDYCELHLLLERGESINESNVIPMSIIKENLLATWNNSYPIKAKRTRTASVSASPPVATSLKTTSDNGGSSKQCDNPLDEVKALFDATSDDRWRSKQRHNRSRKVYVNARRLVNVVGMPSETQPSPLQISKTAKKVRQANRHHRK